MMNALIVVLSVQGATAALVGVASLFGTEGFAHTVVDGRRLGAGFLAFAVMQAVVVIPKIRGSFWLIAIPLAWTCFTSLTVCSNCSSSETRPSWLQRRSSRHSWLPTPFLRCFCRAVQLLPSEV